MEPGSSSPMKHDEGLGPLTDNEGFVRRLVTILRKAYGCRIVPTAALEATARRMLRAADDMTLYHSDPEPSAILEPLFDTPDDYDEMVVMRNITFNSICEHHMLPFFGTAHVAYIPRKVITGASKLVRLVEAWARRPQLQERLTSQIAKTLWEKTEPLGVGVILTAQHTCLKCRGVRNATAEMVTSKLYGYFRDDQRARAEFLSLIGL